MTESGATTPARTPAGGIAPFLVITFAFTWGLWLVAWSAGGDLSSPLVFTLFAIGACGPSFAALTCSLTGRRGARLAHLGSVGRWLPAALVLGLAPAAVAAFVAPLVGGQAVDLGAAQRIVEESGGPVLFVVMFLVAGPLAEEFGWRGHLQPRLSRSLSPTHTALVVGAVWAVWHIPLFFLTGTSQSAMGLLTPTGLLFLAVMLPLSYIYWYVSERLRGGVPSAVLLHFAGNVSLTLLAIGSSMTFLGLFGATVVVLAVALHLRERSTQNAVWEGSSR